MRFPASFIVPIATFLCALAFAPGTTLLRGQSLETGTLTGKVFNPASGEYVEFAEVKIQGTPLSTASASDGSYRIANVPAGQVTVTVDYAGFKAAPAQVSVPAGRTVNQDFSLTQSGKVEGGAVVTLNAFTVSEERDGNAKAIMDQKDSMNVTNIVASETFGNIAEGNVGEFIKYLPGIQLDYVEADARSPRIRGLPAQFTGVSFDGMKLASADGFIQNNGTDNGGAAGSGDRSFGFEQVSMSSIDAVEVNYTTNASNDADSPAGLINLKSRHAYERNGPSVAFDVSAMGNSEQLYLKKTVGPDDASRYKVMPNASLSYSNSFFDHKVGVVVSVNESNSYNEQRQFAPTYDTTPTAADPRPFVLTKLQFKDGPKLNERSTLSASVDYRAAPGLSLSLVGTLNNYDAFVGNRTFAIATASRANVTGDGYTAWTNVPISAVTSTMAYLNKRTHGYTYIPSFSYRIGNLKIDGSVSVSGSVNNYAGAESKSLPGNTVGGTSISTTGMTVSATRPLSDNYAWKIVQTGGLDWGNLANYKASSTAYPQFTEDGRYAKNLVYQGKLDLTYSTGWSIPTVFKTGAKLSESTYIYQNPTSWQVWNYVGPGGGQGGTWGQFPSSYVFAPGHGASITSVTGSPFAVQDHNAIGALFASEPQDFMPTGTAGSYLTAFVNNPRTVKEQVEAPYGMVTSKFFSRLTAQVGVRMERTVEEVKAYAARPTSEVVAAGFPVTASTGIASTIPGIQYQYFTLPRSATSHAYANVFPSGSLRYNFTPNLIALFGYSYTVTRPNYNDIAGVATVNDENQTISTPNPTLKPKYSNNYTGRLSYYFQSIGSVAISAFDNDFKNSVQGITLPPGSAAQFGYSDPMYDTYTVTTRVNAPGESVFRGMTIEYSDALSFLPKPFDGLNVFANLTRTYKKLEGIAPALLNAATPYNYGWMPGVAPWVVSYGLNYHYKRLTAGANARWTDREPYSSTYNSWQKPTTKIDCSVSYRMTNNVSVYASARNIFNVPDYDYANNNTQLIQGSGARGIEYYGAYLYGGIKGRF